MFDSSSIHAKDNATGDVLLHASNSGPVYIVPIPAIFGTVPANVALRESADLWHR